MNWTLLQQLNPYEQWQLTSTAIVPSVEYFKFEWANSNVPKLRNYIAQSNDDFELFEIRKMISGDKHSIFHLPCPTIWSERKIAILCPRIWAAALPQYQVSIYGWQ